MPDKARLATLSVVMLTVVVVMPTTAAADAWYEHYARAERAERVQRWDEVVRELNEALARRGDSGARVRTYGMRVTSYFPYLKIGIAYYHLEQYQAALEAFDTEERLGAVQDDAEALATLQRTRQLARQALSELADQQSQRARQIVSDSISRSLDSERAGQLEQAIDELGPALAVDPSNQEVVEILERLRAEVSQQAIRRADVARRARLVRDGQAFLDQRLFREAASRFQEAQALRQSSAVAALLEQARSGLIAETEQALSAARQQELIESGLRRVGELHAEARLDEALDELQPVLALAPREPRAAELQMRLVQALKQADRDEAIRQALAEAELAFDGGRFEEAVSASNRVLAIDRGNQEALGQLTRAYAEISKALLGSGLRENIPPAIRFVDHRIQGADGELVQMTRRPRLVLSGVAIDAGEVSLELDAAGSTLAADRFSSQQIGDSTVTEFVLELDLAAGLSIMRLTATDTAGLSSTSEYAVVYQRPVWRSPWTYLLLTAVFGSFTVAMILVRQRRRRRTLRRRFNPYVAGAPVLDQSMFFGRDQLVDRVLQTIHSNSLLLHGERRIGKTSLQHHLRRRLLELEDPQYRFFPAYIDLQGTPEERFFSTICEDVFQELEPWLTGLEPGLSPPAEYGYRDLVKDLRAVLERLATHTRRKVKLVLLIDEVDELNAYGPRTSQKLRSLFMKSFAESLVAVVSGVSIRREWDRAGSPWYNFFEEIEVDAIDREAARRLVLEPVRGVFELEPDAVEEILSRTRCKPYLIQRLCVQVVNRLHEQGRAKVLREDVAIVASALRYGSPDGAVLE